MANLKKYNLNGESVGEVAVEESFWQVETNRQMIKDYIVAVRKNMRQWSANTKGRSEVKHTTKKPYRQKGTGNARQGMLVTSQYRGGGIVFGPKPKFDQHVRINRKERRLAIHQLLAEKWKENKIIVVEDALFKSSLQTPKTKEIVVFLKKLEIERRVLFVGESLSEKDKVNPYEIFKKSMNNLQRCHFVMASQLSGYNLAAAQKIIISESALVELQELVNKVGDKG